MERQTAFFGEGASPAGGRPALRTSRTQGGKNLDPSACGTVRQASHKSKTIGKRQTQLRAYHCPQRSALLLGESGIPTMFIPPSTLPVRGVRTLRHARMKRAACASIPRFFMPCDRLHARRDHVAEGSQSRVPCPDTPSSLQLSNMIRRGLPATCPLCWLHPPRACARMHRTGE